MTNTYVIHDGNYYDYKNITKLEGNETIMGSCPNLDDFGEHILTDAKFPYLNTIVGIRYIYKAHSWLK